MNPPGTEPDARLVQAQLALLRGDHQTARDLCRHVLDTDPNWPAALALMGRIQDATGQPDEALHWLGAAVERDPDNPVWKEHRDRLVRNAMRNPARNPRRPTPQSETESGESESVANHTLRETLQATPKPIRIALIAGALLALILGIIVGTHFATRSEPTLKPNVPTSRNNPDPILVDQPEPGPSAPQFPTPSQGSATAPQNPTTPPDRTPPKAPSEAQQPAPTLDTTAEIVVNVANAREARWNPSNVTLSLWISVDRPVPADEKSKGEIRTTAETIVRNALPQFPDARRVRVQVEQWRGN
ncbi:MAG: tetratricopeptide repeat protein, partial [Armatimonadaceae bacterium]